MFVLYTTVHYSGVLLSTVYGHHIQQSMNPPVKVDSPACGQLTGKMGNFPVLVCAIGSLRTDGIHCRESAGTGPVVLKVVPVTGAAMCSSLFPHPLMVCSGYVR